MNSTSSMVLRRKTQRITRFSIIDNLLPRKCRSEEQPILSVNWISQNSLSMRIKRTITSGVIGIICLGKLTYYRQWLVRHFELPSSLEVAFTTRLIENDILNNSAWSHRYYTLFGNGNTSNNINDKVVDSEIEYSQKIIRMLSSNAAPWNYLRGYTTYIHTSLMITAF